MMASENRRRRTKDGNTGLKQADLAADEMGNNNLQGDDQANVRNQRRTVPETRTEADGVIESFEKLDKEVRAKEDLGKGNRSS
jgi:hypothetical protein